MRPTLSTLDGLLLAKYNASDLQTWSPAGAVELQIGYVASQGDTVAINVTVEASEFNVSANALD